MVFMGRGFTSGGQKSGSVFSTAVCKIQASKRCVESLPLVLKDKRNCFSQGERFLHVLIPMLIYESQFLNSNFERFVTKANKIVKKHKIATLIEAHSLVKIIELY